MSEATGATRKVTTDGDGYFVVLQLEPGTYRIEADDEAYRDFGARVAVATNDEVVVRLPLGLASISEAVDTRPFFIPIDRYSPERRTRLPGAFISELPLDGRTVLDAVMLTPGLIPTGVGPAALGGPTPAPLADFLVDGFHNSDAFLGAAVSRVPVGSVLELEVLRPTFDAAHGGSAGPQVSVVTRSGSNAATGGASAFHQSELNRNQMAVFGGGPLVRDRTFGFASYERTAHGDTAPEGSRAHDLDGRLDQTLGGSRLMIRYGGSQSTVLDRAGHQFGAAFSHFPAGRLANDLRIAVTDLEFGASAGALPASRAYRLSDTASVWAGRHMVKAGAEWLHLSSAVSNGDTNTGGGERTVWSAFVQDDWRPAGRLAVSGGMRLERVTTDGDSPGRSNASPRIGLSWTVGNEAATAVRGGYGRYHGIHGGVAGSTAVDHWTASVEQQWGRTRTVEAAYVGTYSNPPDGVAGSTRFNGILAEIEQRSETGLTGHLAYTYGRSTVETAAGGSAPSALQSRHKLTGAFTVWLPFGDERRWLTKGLVADVLGDMQASAVFAILGARPVDTPAGRDRGFRTLDIGLVKNWYLGAKRTLQIRAETFNTLNRPNPWGPLFSSDPSIGFSSDYRGGRRYQFGARAIF